MITMIMEKKIEEEWVLVLLATIMFFCPFLMRYGKRFADEDPESLLAKDKRQIVLILRAFTLDQNAWWGGAGSELNFEQSLTSILSCVGPVVAVGKPGEHLAPSGAARIYIPDESWKNRVVQLMNEAKIVILILYSENPSVQDDKLKGFRWEIQEATKKLDSRKMLFILPAATQLVLSVASYSFHRGKKKRFARKKSFEDFYRLIKSELPYNLPPSVEKAQFLYFNSHGHPETVRTRARGLLGFSLALRPFFRELGVKPCTVNPLLLLWRFNVVYRAVFLAGILMLIFILVIALWQ